MTPPLTEHSLASGLRYDECWNKFREGVINGPHLLTERRSPAARPGQWPRRARETEWAAAVIAIGGASEVQEENVPLGLDAGQARIVWPLRERAIIMFQGARAAAAELGSLCIAVPAIPDSG
eukprot:768204-Hanusia_phi.AAC.1